MGRRESPLAGRVIFVVGARRSGTNWLQRVLASHPRVAAAPSETFLFSAGLRPLRERFHHGAMSSSTTGSVYADRDVLLDRMRDLCDAVFTGLMQGLKPSADHFVERTPDHVHHLDLIGEVYPDSRVVHIIRDGRDVVRSLLSQEWGPGDVREAALEWRSAVESARAASTRPTGYHEVRYEDILDDPDGCMRKLFAVLDLEADETAVARAVAEAAARFNVDSTDSRLRAGKWREGLDPKVLGAVIEETRDLLLELGYEVEQRPHEPAGQPASLPREPVPGNIAMAPSKPLRLQRLLRSLSSKARFATKPPAPKPDARMRLAEMQVVADSFLTATSGDPKGIMPLLHDDVFVRIVTDGQRYEGRGEPAGRVLVDALRSDEALRGRQMLGYLHPSMPAFTFVGRFEASAGRHLRVIVLDVSTKRVKRVAYYAFSEVPEQA